MPKNGSYAIDYDIVNGTAFFDTFLNGAELGYVGGLRARNFTKALYLRAGSSSG